MELHMEQNLIVFFFLCCLKWSVSLLITLVKVYATLQIFARIASTLYAYILE